MPKELLLLQHRLHQGTAVHRQGALLPFSRDSVHQSVKRRLRALVPLLYERARLSYQHKMAHAEVEAEVAEVFVAFTTGLR
jgi:hypothetical protein